MTSSLKRCERVEGNILLAIVKTASDREAALEMHGAPGVRLVVASVDLSKR